MGSPTSQLKSLSLLTASIGTKAGASIIVFLVAAKVWGSEEFGNFIYDFSLASILCLVCDYGFSNQILKNGSNQRDNLPPLIAAKLWLTIITIALGLVINATGIPASEDNFLLILFAVIIGSYFDFYCTYLRATNKTTEDFYLSTTTNIATIAALIFAIHQWKESRAFCIAMLATRAIQLLTVPLITRNISAKIFATLPHLHPRNTARTLRFGFSFAADTAVNAALNHVDSVFLNHAAGAAATGKYQAAARFNQGIPLLYSVLVSYFLPKLAETRSSDKYKQLKRNFLNLSLLTWLSLAISFLAIATIYSQQPSGTIFHDAAPYFLGLALIALLRIYSGWLSTLLTASGRQRQKTAAYTLCLLTVLLSTHYLITIFGVWGVMLSQVIGYTLCITAMTAALKLHKTTKERNI